MVRSAFQLFLWAAAVLMSVQIAAAAPKVVVDEPVHDFGVVLEGQVIEHSFVIKNSGDTVLNITHVIPP